MAHLPLATPRHSLRPGKRLSLTALQSRNDELKKLPRGVVVHADTEPMQAFRASLPAEQQALAGEVASSSSQQQAAGSSRSHGKGKGGAKRGAGGSSEEPSPKRGLISSMFGFV